MRKLTCGASIAAAFTSHSTFSRSKCLFAGIDLGGSWIERDKDTTAALIALFYFVHNITAVVQILRPEAQARVGEVVAASTVRM
jgi:hypothetical protein